MFPRSDGTFPVERVVLCRGHPFSLLGVSEVVGVGDEVGGCFEDGLLVSVGELSE